MTTTTTSTTVAKPNHTIHIHVGKVWGSQRTCLTCKHLVMVNKQRFDCVKNNRSVEDIQEGKHCEFHRAEAVE